MSPAKLEIVESMIALGRQMSNICFNLKQDSRLEMRTRETLGMCQVQWDRLQQKLRDLP